MAKVFGRIPANAAEKEVVYALKIQAPHDWLVIPSVRWAKRRDGGAVLDGEADIVVLVPSLGMLVIEVKGSREIRVTESGWQRMERGEWVDISRSPVDQATSNVHELKRIVCEENRWGDRFPGNFAWMVVYPNGHATSIPALFDRSTLVTRGDMPELSARVRAALTAKGSSDVARGFSDAVKDCVARVLTSSDFRIVPADGAKEVTEDKGEIEKLTLQQFSALRGLFELPSVAVCGPAGSGKTVLAMWQLQSAMESGGRAIYVCYNRVLAESLRIRYPSMGECIHSVDSFFGRMCPGVRAQVGSGDSFYRSHLPNEVFDRVSAWAEQDRFDAVIVDEAQDLSDDQLIALQCFKKESGTWSLFMDRRQNLYRRGYEEQVAADVIYRLMHNCRNTVFINSAVNTYVGDEVASMPGMPEGVAVVVEKVGRSNMANRAFQCASEWKRDRNNSVAILSPRVMTESAMHRSELGYGLAISQDISKLGDPNSVVFSTVRSFKGVEADCVVLVDAVTPEKGEQFFGLEDVYVACTRARTRLVILTDDEESHGYFMRSLGRQNTGNDEQ